jgi:hypothetical protein
MVLSSVELKYLLPSEILFFPFPPVFTLYSILLSCHRCQYICTYCVLQPFFSENFYGLHEIIYAKQNSHNLIPELYKSCKLVADTSVKNLIGSRDLGRACRLSSKVRLLGVPRTQHRSCLVPDDRIPCTVQERRGGSSVCGRRPTPSGTQHRPESVSSAVGGALQLGAGPHTVPPVLRQFPLRPFL